MPLAVRMGNLQVLGMDPPALCLRFKGERKSLDSKLEYFFLNTKAFPCRENLH